MAKELILIPKTKYDFLTKSSENTPTSRYGDSDEQLENVLKYAVPINVLNKSLGLLNYLKDRKGPLLDWDHHGELVVKGGSHLIDLLKYSGSSLSKRALIGYDHFRSVLAEMLAPVGLMAHIVTTSEEQIGQGFVNGTTERGPTGRKQNQFRWIPY